MENAEHVVCRLCQYSVEHINNDTNNYKNIFTILLPNLQINKEEEIIMCKVCSIKILAAVKFKTQCLETEKTLTSYIKSREVQPLNLITIYEKVRNEPLNCINNQNICRLCMQLVNTKCTPFSHEECEMAQMFMPEVNLSLTKNPAACEVCLKSLTNHTDFFKNWLDKEVRIKTKYGNCIEENPHGSSELHVKESIEIKQHPKSENDIKIEWEDGIVDTPEFYELQIKQESIDIKSEDESQKESPRLEDVTREAEWCHGNKQFKSEYASAMKDYAVAAHREESRGRTPKIKRRQHNIYSHRTLKSDSLNKHKAIHSDQSTLEMLKCENCSYQTSCKGSLKKHKLKHADPSDIEMFQCDKCSYQTKYKSALMKHNLRHADPSEIQMLKCASCPYQTKYKNIFKIHQLKHGDPFQIKQHKCNTCSYQGFCEGDLNRHKLKHADLSDVEVFKCDECDHQTRYKHDLKKHKLKHADPSDIELFKCDKCPYETKYKNALTKHKVKHADPSDIEMFQCHDCSYRTRYKHNLEVHKLKHADPFKMDERLCEIIRKRNLKQSKLKQADSSEMKEHKCDMCAYRTLSKSNLTQHKLKHADPSEIRMFACHQCAYQSKYKGSLKRHKLLHADTS